MGVGKQPHSLLAASGAQGTKLPGQSGPREGCLGANYPAWSLPAITAVRVSESGDKASGGESLRKNSVAENMEGGSSAFHQAQPEGPCAQGPELSGGEGELLSAEGGGRFLGGPCVPQF